MNRHGTDKLFVHHYEAEYERHLAPLRDLPLRVLEIGVGGYGVPGKGGESLRVWRDYGPQWQITGIDIEDKSHVDGERIRTAICDQSKPDQLIGLDQSFGPFDLIIDDGSHIQGHIETSFRTLFPRLNPGGIYVIEDLATSYDPAYGGDAEPLSIQTMESGDSNTIGLLADLIDVLHWRHWRSRSPDAIDRMVKSVHISHELAFIYKA